jgi:hypothetical protein
MIPNLRYKKEGAGGILCEVASAHPDRSMRDSGFAIREAGGLQAHQPAYTCVADRASPFANRPIQVT